MTPLEKLRLKFTSSNNVPVFRATVTKEEWESLEAYVEVQHQLLLDANKQLNQLREENSRLGWDLQNLTR